MARTPVPVRPASDRATSALRTLLVVLVLAGCPWQSARPAPAPESQPPVVFSDDFERDARGPDWTAQHGSWTILDRALFCVGPGVVTCNRTLPDHVRVDYDCTSREPCDLSLLLFARPGSSMSEAYFFGFGSEGNTVNKLLRCRRRIALDTKHLPVAKRWHHVTVERRGPFLAMWIDGEKSLEAFDPKADEMKHRHWGFYVYTQGKIDNIRVRELAPPAADAVQEPEATVREFFPFAADEVGKKPEKLEATAGTRCTVQVVHFPNVIPKRTSKGSGTVQDPCVELVSGGWGSSHVAAVRCGFEPLATGLVEVDVMATDEARNGGQIQLVAPDHTALATFGWDDDGHYFNSGPDGRKPIDCRVEFPHRSTKTLLRHQAGRWLTMRLEFDADKGEYDAALMDYYRHNGAEGEGSPDALTHRIPLATKLPFRRQGTVAGVTVATDSRSRLLVDNLIVYGPVGPFTVRGRDRRFSAARLLGLQFEPRRDPFRLKVFTSRHILTHKGPKREQRSPAYKPFKQAGVAYSRLLVRQAKAAERLRHHERACYYLETAGRSDEALRRARSAADKAVRKSERALATAYERFAEAYTHHLDPEKLGALYRPSERKLAALLGKAERRGKALEDALAAYAAGVPPLERCVAGRDMSKCVWRNGRYEVDGVPAHVHPQVAHVVWWQDHLGLEEVLELPCMVRAHRRTYGCEPGELSSTSHFSRFWGQFAKTRPHATYELNTAYGAHDIWMAVPSWWVEEHAKKDPDVLFRGRDGKALGLPPGQSWTKMRSHGPTSFLNYWHPDVQKLMRDTATGYAAFMAREYPGRVKAIVVGAEQIHAIYGNETGHNRTARLAFTDYLKRTYGNDLARLNRAWGTTHATFEQIAPPPARAKMPSGVAYDFQRFRQEGYMAWVRTIASGFKETLGPVPLLSYFNITLGGIDRVVGFDLVALFNTYDVTCYHTFHRPSWFPMERCLDSLRKAYPGHGLGRMEWGASTTAPDLSDERCYLANGLALQFCDLAWGHTHHAYWYGTAHGWSEGCNWTEYRLGNAVLRYSSAYIPLTIERCRALGRPAIDHPTIQPDAAVLEVTSSFLNALPDSLYFLGVRRGMLIAARALEDLWVNYGFLYEEPVLEGRQDLKGYQTIVVPLGLCCPRKLAERLLGYVREGGTLVLLGPCGLYDRYGKPDNYLLGTVFPDVEWRRSGRGWWLSGRGTTGLKHAQRYGKFGRVLDTRVGLGRLVVFTDLTDLDAGLLRQTLDRSVGRTYDISDREHFQVVVRDAPDCWFMYIVNMDWRRAHEAKVTFHRASTGVLDMGCAKPTPVPHLTGNDSTAFWVRLTPAEGTVLRINKLGPVIPSTPAHRTKP